MGLLLSVFVVFVSVVELLTVYSDFRRRLQPVNSDRDFSPLIRRYEAGLHKERQRILKILDEYRKLEKIAECQTEGEPSTSQPDAHQSTTSCSGIESKYELSRSPSPAIPAVPRNSFCIESTETQNDFCKDEPNNACPPEEVIEGKKEDDIEKLHRQSKGILKDDSFEKIANALHELVSSKSGEKSLSSNSEENVILCEIAPRISTVSIKEDALEVASKSDIIAKRKKEEIEIKKICFEKKLLSVECPSKITSHHANLDITDNKEKIISKEDSLNTIPEHNNFEIINDTDKSNIGQQQNKEQIISLNNIPEHNNLEATCDTEKSEIAQQELPKYNKEKIASNEDINTEKGDDIQRYISKTEEKTVLKENSLNVIPEHTLEVVSDIKVSDITQQQMPLNDEEIVLKEDILNTASEHNEIVQQDNDSLQIISEHNTEKNIDNQHQVSNSVLEVISEQRNQEINAEESKTIQQQVSDNEKGVGTKDRLEAIPDHSNFIEKCDTIQQQVSKTEEKQDILKEDSRDIPKHDKLENIDGTKESDIVQQPMPPNDEKNILKDDPTSIISERNNLEIIGSVGKSEIAQQQVSENDKGRFVSKKDPLQIISELIHETNIVDNIQQQVPNNEKGEILLKEDHSDTTSESNHLEIITDNRNSVIPQQEISKNAKEEVIFREDSLQIIPEHINHTEKSGIQHKVCTAKEEQVTPKEVSQNIVSENSGSDIVQQIVPKEVEEKVILEDARNIISEHNNLEIISDAQNSKVIQQELSQIDHGNLISKEDSSQIISEHIDDTVKSDNIQRKAPKNEQEILSKGDPLDIIPKSNILEIVDDNRDSEIVQQEMPTSVEEKALLKEGSLRPDLKHHIHDREKNDNIQQVVCKIEEERVALKEDFLNIISEHSESDLVQQKLPGKSEEQVISEEDPIKVSEHNNLEIINNIQKSKVVQDQVSQKDDEKLISKEDSSQIIFKHIDDTVKSDNIQQKTPKIEQEVLPQGDPPNIIPKSNILEIADDNKDSEIAQQEIPTSVEEKVFSKEDSLQSVTEHINDRDKSDNTQQLVCKTEEERVALKEDFLNITSEHSGSDIVQQKLPGKSEEKVISKEDLVKVSEHNNLEIISDIQERKVVQEQVSQRDDENLISEEDSLQITQAVSMNDNHLDVIPESTNLEIINDSKNGEITQQQVPTNDEREVISKEDSSQINSEHIHDTVKSDNIQQEVSKTENHEALPKDLLDIISESNSLEIINDSKDSGITQQKMSTNDEEKVLPKEDSLQTTCEHINDLEKSDGIQQVEQVCKTEEERVTPQEDSLNVITKHNGSDIAQQTVFTNVEEQVILKDPLDDISESNNLEIMSDAVNNKIVLHNDEKLTSKEDSLQIISEHEKSADIQQQIPPKTETRGAAPKEDSVDILSEHNHSEIRNENTQQQMPGGSEKQIISREDNEHNHTENIEVRNKEEKFILKEDSLQTVPEGINDTEKRNDTQQQIPNNEKQVALEEDHLEIISQQINDTKKSDNTQQQVLKNETNNLEAISDNIPKEPSKNNDENILRKASTVKIEKCPLEIAHLEEVKLHSITFDSVDYWPNKALIGKKKGKSKSNKKRVKFGLHVEELEPEWSRAPSPIFKLINSPSSSEVHSPPPAEQPRTCNLESFQITDLSQQIVAEDYWRRSPSPFRDFLESNTIPEESARGTSQQIASEDGDDKESSLHLLRELEKPDSISWDPNRKILSSDEEAEEVPFGLDKEFINTLDGLKTSKLEERKKSRRKHGRKSSKQNSLESDSRTNNSGISESSLLETEVAETSTNKISSGESKSIRKVEKRKRPDEDRLRKQENSASKAFW
ncbi:hypothetical protein ILUMI_02366, partial [Ignelater luminosus]